MPVDGREPFLPVFAGIPSIHFDCYYCARLICSLYAGESLLRIKEVDEMVLDLCAFEMRISLTTMSGEVARLFASASFAVTSAVCSATFTSMKRL